MPPTTSSEVRNNFEESYSMGNPSIVLVARTIGQTSNPLEYTRNVVSALRLVSPYPDSESEISSQIGHGGASNDSDRESNVSDNYIVEHIVPTGDIHVEATHTEPLWRGRRIVFLEVRGLLFMTSAFLILALASSIVFHPRLHQLPACLVSILERSTQVLDKFFPGDRLTQYVGLPTPSPAESNFSLMNFAASARGARPIPALISATYQADSFGNWLGLDLNGPFPPDTVLKSDLKSGQCWPFKGKTGHIAVELAKPVAITHVGYDHVSKDTKFAPRSLTVSGLLYRDDHIDIPAGIQTAEIKSLEIIQVTIAEFQYDVNSSSHMQTFPVIEEINALRINFRAVLFNITDNWGSNDMTCLYRLRIHGFADSNDEDFSGIRFNMQTGFSEK